MSVRVMTLVWAIDLPDSEKIVLLALADCANDEGHCWPSMRTLAKKCSKTDRTVQAAIKALVDSGHLTRREVPGKGCNYTVHPRNSFTPETASPPKQVRDTPEAASDKPSKNHQSNSKTRGTRLPEDWEPAALTESLAAISLADAAKELERFRDWAAAAPGEKGVKLDWDATWRNWLRKAMEEGRVKVVANGKAAAPVAVDADAMSRKAEFFRRIGKDDDAAEYDRRADKMRKGGTASIGSLVQGLSP